jgi:hypothetical protein
MEQGGEQFLTPWHARGIGRRRLRREAVLRLLCDRAMVWMVFVGLLWEVVGGRGDFKDIP